MTKETGGPAYFTDKHAVSMTLRDYFAAKAMQGLLSSIGEWTAGTKGLEFSDTVATDAYWIADAMLEARK